jgi:thiol:disulfide interchange protein DsbA
MGLSFVKKTCSNLLLSMLLILISWSTNATDYLADEHYQILAQPIDATNKGKIVVNEFFGYTCPHCNQFDPLLHHWAKTQPEDVIVVHVPVIFNRSWEPYAKAYYISHQLGVFEQAHQAMYDAIHIDQRRIANRQALEQFFTELNVTVSDFATAYDSFDLKNKLRQGRKLALQAKISQVPSILINGQYLITAKMAGSQAKMLEVADFLIMQIKQAAAK